MAEQRVRKSKKWETAKTAPHQRPPPNKDHHPPNTNTHQRPPPTKDHHPPETKLRHLILTVNYLNDASMSVQQRLFLYFDPYYHLMKNHSLVANRRLVTEFARNIWECQTFKLIISIQTSQAKCSLSTKVRQQCWNVLCSSRPSNIRNVSCCYYGRFFLN
jgi:hypothetical protein